jgi:hypothetical protein
MGIAGSDHAELRRALDAGLWGNAWAAAHSLAVVPLDAALELTLLAAHKKPARFEELAVRWLTRYAAEKDPPLGEYSLAAALLRWAGEGSDQGAAELRDLVARETSTVGSPAGRGHEKGPPPARGEGPLRES